MLFLLSVSKGLISIQTKLACNNTILHSAPILKYNAQMLHVIGIYSIGLVVSTYRFPSDNLDTNCLDPDQACQNISPVLDPDSLKL